MPQKALKHRKIQKTGLPCFGGDDSSFETEPKPVSVRPDEYIKDLWKVFELLQR
jgi:hypothetical protein